MAQGFHPESLIQLRKDRGWTQEELARRSGLATVTVVKLEQGRVSDPRVITLARLASVMDCPIDAFLQEPGASSAMTPVPSGTTAGAPEDTTSTPSVAPPTPVPAATPTPVPAATPTPTAPGSPRPDPDLDLPSRPPHPAKPFFLRPRGRASVIVVVLGVPLVLAYLAARVMTDALWFDELGQGDVFTRTLAAKAELFVIAGGVAALVVGANLTIALRRVDVARTRVVGAAVAAASLVVGSYFGSSTLQHWQTFLLWRHRQSFAVAEPLHGEDIGFFVFTLPFELAVVRYLLLLLGVGALTATLVYWRRGAVVFRPLRLSNDAQVHLAAIGAASLLLVAWRLHLARYALELRQPSPGGTHSFAGAGYVDVHVRSPGLAVLSIIALVSALAWLAAPRVARSGYRRRAVFLIAGPAIGLVVGAILVTSFLPALVQRYAVDPDPVHSEEPFLLLSISATRSAFGLDDVEVVPYSPTGTFTPTDLSGAREQLSRVAIWDPSLLRARMRELVTETPYYDPQSPTYELAHLDGRRQLTITSARELEIRRVRDARTWENFRFAYTHGLGLVRFSSTDTDASGHPRLVDPGVGLRQPRIYFGRLPPSAPDWVVAATRRTEVDMGASEGATQTGYHYDGTGGIQLATWFRRAAFAFKLGSKELLLSDDIGSESRLLLHRDVRDRLRALAPFIRWDGDPVPLAVNDGIVFLVDGYTTSDSYPYAERVDLGGTSVNYVRPSVRATVDAFSGAVDIYLDEEADPIARAWAEAFPTLFRPMNEMSAEVRGHLRYPADLFAAQATAYERFHTTSPERFASGADLWSRPIALSGALEVAGDVDFDESDEDDLQARSDPGYKFAAPPGRSGRVLLLETWYSPWRGQNLVGTLSGWVDEEGNFHLAARSFSSDEVILGPAQVSRLVFATPRVRNLLGLRNLETRDLDKSSIDSVILGEPHLMFSPTGVIQIQSLFEGARGPGAARLLGVTAFVNGRAGLGPDIFTAFRQAVNKPPRIQLLRPSQPATVGTPVKLRFDVDNGQRQRITITSPAGRETASFSLTAGRGTFVWIPTEPGRARVRAEMEGLDGSVVTDRVAFRVLGPPPTVRVTRTPIRATAGRPVHVLFEVTHARGVTARVSTRAGIEFTRRFAIRKGTGVVAWTPSVAGRAEILIRVQGSQGQAARARVRIRVAPRPPDSLAQVPLSVAIPIERAKTALSKAETDIAAHRYGQARDSLKILLRNVVEANRAAEAQIGLPPTDPESDEPPGPGSVFAVLSLDHQVTMHLVPLFDGLTDAGVITSLQDTLTRTHRSRDAMLDMVIALPAEGARGDYDDGMADTLGMYPSEENLITTALLSFDLTAPARTGLSNALARVQATEAKVVAVWGGGE